MAASSQQEKLEPRVFTATATRADAAQVRETLERTQKIRADGNLLTLRYMIQTSRDQRETFVADGAAEVEAALKHPVWEKYDPLDRSEHIYRFTVPAHCLGVVHMVNITYTNIAQFLNQSISSRSMDNLSSAAWLQHIADSSCGALCISEHRWDFAVPAYREIKFTAHQLLFSDTHSVKLFVIVLNDSTPYDFFFYFF